MACTTVASAEELRAHLCEAQQALAETREALLSTQKALAEAEHKLRNKKCDFCKFVDSANAPIVAVDLSGLITHWNLKAEEVFGFTGKSAQRTALSELIHKDEQAAFQDFQATILAKQCHNGSGSVRQLQQRFRLKSNTVGKQWHEVNFLASSFPCTSSTGSCEGALYIGQELTQLCKNELKQQDRPVREVNAPMIAVDVHGCVDEWNHSAELLTGFKKAEAVGKNLVRNFVLEDSSDSVQTMLSQVLNGQEITNYEFSIWTKNGQQKEMLWSAAAKRDCNDQIVGVVGVGQDITELRSESKMLANYVRICGAAVWSLRGNANTGAVTQSKTKEIEHLISQQAQIAICDPRMVLWRASFVSILKTMCQNFWMRRKQLQGAPEKSDEDQDKRRAEGRSQVAARTEVFTTDFGYEFCFEAPNGSVKWYKVQGHLIQETVLNSQFEVTGSMQEVTSMLIDKVMGDRWQKWWSRMCHMVFDATLLVDTQEYRVLNAWGEEKVFGCKLQSHHPLLQLIKEADTVSLKEAFNEVTFKGFERGRTLHLLRSACQHDTPAQCFFLSADQENPNECMMGIRMQVTADKEHGVLWDVAKPNPVLTLEDLARLKSGLKRSHRRPARNLRRPARSRPSDPLASSHSLSSIPEDLHGEFESDMSDRGSGPENSDTGSLRSSSKSSNSSSSSNADFSEAGNCNSSSARSACDECMREASDWYPNPFGLSPKTKPRKTSPPRPPPVAVGLPTVPARPTQRKARVGPPVVKLRWAGQAYNLNLEDFATVMELRLQVQKISGVLPSRQTLILAGRRLPLSETPVHGEPAWQDIKDDVRPGQTLMMLGSASPAGEASENTEVPGLLAEGASPTSGSGEP